MSMPLQTHHLSIFSSTDVDVTDNVEVADYIEIVDDVEAVEEDIPLDWDNTIEIDHKFKKKKNCQTSKIILVCGYH